MKFPFVTYHKYAEAKDIFDKATDQRVSAYTEAQKPKTIGIVALSKRWGIADLNDVKRIADREAANGYWGESIMYALYYGTGYRDNRSQPDTYSLPAIEAYEARVRQGITNSAIAKELTALKKEDAKKAKK